MTEQTGQQQTGQQQTGQQQQGPPEWYTNPPKWLTSPPQQQSTQQHTGGGSDLTAEIQAMPEKVVRALQDAITAATQQHNQQNSGQQNSGQQQQDNGQQNSGQQNSGQQQQQQSDTGPSKQTFSDWWFSKT